MRKRKKVSFHVQTRAIRSLLSLILLCLILISFSPAPLREVHSLGDFVQEKPMDDLQLVRSICLAINDPAQRKDIFNGLPSSVQDALSAEDFELCMEALQPAGGEPILAYEALDNSEAAELKKGIEERSPEFSKLAERSTFYRLYYHPSQKGYRDEDRAGILLAIQHDGQKNSPYLSKLWCDAMVRIHDFATLYFDTLSHDVLGKGDTRALSYLIQSGENPFQSADASVFADFKAEQIRIYYRDYVLDDPTQSVCLYLLPAYAAYTQSFRYSSRLSGTRSVFFRENDGQFTVHEEMSQSLSRDMSRILISGEPLFPDSFASKRHSFTERDLHPLAGPLMSAEPLERIDGQSRYLLHYYGMEIVIRGNVNLSRKKWQGDLESLRFTSRIFSLGGVVRIGMTEEDWYLTFPFYSDRDRVFTTNNGIFSDEALSYEVNENGSLESFTLRRADLD